KYADEAKRLWATSLSAKAQVFLENIIEEGLNEIASGKNIGLLRVAMQAAGLLTRLRPASDKGEDSYDEVILKRHRKL
ncbi:hypothetical protein LCGC14_2197600, partial [marine sediment metagenome]